MKMCAQFIYTHRTHIGKFKATEIICAAAAAAKSLQKCPTPRYPTDGSPPGSSGPGILQARILEWVAISFSNACMQAKLLQPCPTLCDPMDRSPAGSSIHRILQARILEWVAISFSEIICRKRKMSCNSLEKKAGQGLEEEEQYIIYLLSLLH